MLAGFHSQALVTHALQRNDLLADFVLGEALARNGVVLAMVWAIDAAVDAVVRQVQRREEHDAVAVEAALKVAGEFHITLGEVGKLTLEQYGGLAVGEALAGGSLVDDVLNQAAVGAVALCIVERFENLGIVDKFLGMSRFRIVCHSVFLLKVGSINYLVMILSLYRADARLTLKQRCRLCKPLTQQVPIETKSSQAFIILFF